MSAQRGVEQATDQVKVRLKKGENQLVIKITNGGGEDGIRFNIGSEAQTKLAAALKGGKSEEIVRAYLAYGPQTTVSKEYRATVAEKAKIEAQVPRTLIAEEMPKPRPAYLLNRGEYDQRGALVSRTLPAVFETKLPEINRLGLA